MARQTVKRLHDLEIDEISLVDRGANQHATVAIAKRDEEQRMGIYDADGHEVDPSTLQAGEFVYDEDGNEFAVVNEDEVAEEDRDQLYSIEAEDATETEQELVGVGKSFTGEVARGYKGAMGPAKGHGASIGSFARRNQKQIATGAGAGTAGYVGGRVKKSLGESVYEELSKALTDGDRDEVISKALGTIEIYKAQAEDAWALAQTLADERDNEVFLEVAKSYALPVETSVLAEIMKSAAATMPAAHVDALDRIFSSVGESLYAEIGANGGLPSSDTMEMVSALAQQHVGKSDLSQEQAIVALFDANPDAYDSYIAEKG